MVEVNTLLTNDFGGKVSLRNCRRVVDWQGKLVCGVAKSFLRDLNGNKIATAVSRKKNANGNGVTIVEYRDDNGVLYTLTGDKLTCGNVYIGKIDQRVRNWSNITLLSATAAVLILTLALILLIELPYNNYPRFSVEDNNGSWDAQGQIVVLDGSIKPGSSGAYTFIVENPHNVELKYSFHVYAEYNEERTEIIPLLFRMKLNDQYLGAKDDMGVVLNSLDKLSVSQMNYSGVEFMPNSKHKFVIEWEWPMDGGNDTLDTLMGQQGGSLRLIFVLSAELA